jgi:diacylglycerol kinase family enzyme
MADEDDREYFLRRVKEELESEGQDLRHLVSKARDALIAIARRIAARLRTTVEKVLDA